MTYFHKSRKGYGLTFINKKVFQPVFNCLNKAGKLFKNS